MYYLSDPLRELKGLSDSVASKLVDTLFKQVNLLIIAAATFTCLGLIGFVGTGSAWYLAGACMTSAVCAFRLWQVHIYRHCGNSGSPVIWARRAVFGAWMTAASWGMWAFVPIFEPNKSLILIFLTALSTCMLGAAIRNCAVRIIPEGQAVLTLLPLSIALLLSGDGYFRLYSPFIVLHFVASLSIIRYAHQQMLQVFVQDQEKTELVSRLAAVNQELEVSNQQLTVLAGSDALTGIANRRSFDITAAMEWHRGLRGRTKLSLLLLDIDHFKKYNDFYGHQAGDACLRDVAAVVASAVRRPGDLVARYGGEEFAVILPGISLAGAYLVGEQVLAAVAARCLPHDDSPFRYVTVSVGAACMVPCPDETLTSLIAAADAALYTSKRSGRNRVSAANSERVDVVENPGG